MPDHPPFVTVADLEAFMRRNLDLTGGEAVCQSVSDEIRGHTRQTITEATTTDRRFYPRGGAIFLDELPVDEDSVAITVDGEEFDGFEVNGRTGIVCLTTMPVGEILVTYTHGYPAGDPKLGTARRVALYAAARAYANPEQVMQKRRDTYSAGYGSSTVEVSGLTSWERTLLLQSYPRPNHAF